MEECTMVGAAQRLAEKLEVRDMPTEQQHGYTEYQGTDRSLIIQAIRDEFTNYGALLMSLPPCTLCEEYGYTTSSCPNRG